MEFAGFFLLMQATETTWDPSRRPKRVFVLGRESGSAGPEWEIAYELVPVASERPELQ